MPNVAPPAHYVGDPIRWTLPAGTRLSRIHDVAWDVLAFNPTVVDRHWGGGRFDATHDDPYGYIYAGTSDPVAVSEALLRDVPFDDAGARILPKASLKSRRFGWLAPRVPLDLVSLRSGEDLAAVAQDTWLVHAPSRDYGFTRRWGHQIRRWAPWARGFVWYSRREPDGLAFVFFDDRCPADAFEAVTAAIPVPPSESRLDVGAGTVYVRQLLERYRVTVSP
jgi:hypothetical protein